MITTSDFNNIVLSKIELKALKTLNRNSPFVIDKQVAKVLLKAKLINKCFNGYDDIGNPIYNGKYSINDDGKKYLIWRNNNCIYRRAPIIISIIAIVLTTINIVLQLLGFI